MKRRRNISKSINTENLKDNIFTTLTTGNSAISDEDRQKIITKLEANMAMQFSEEQKQVIRHYDKPLNVIACAGAGKSTVLINKMFYTEMLYSVKPSSMLAITFNADASQELSKRYNKIKKSLGIRHKVHPTFKTFHSLFYMLLKTLPRYKKSEIVSESKYTFELLKLIISDGTKDNKETFSDIMKYRGTVINKSISPDGLENVTFDSVTFRPHIYTKVVERYEELKALDNAMDFDDMMVILQRELKGIDGDTLRENFRSIFTHVYVDEFQDISKLQLDIMDNLIEKFDYFTTIGDDDQSIYAFRGSEPRYIREFISRYPHAERLFLGDNYRCKSEILTPITACIKNNLNRVDKSIRAFNSGGHVNVVPIEKSIKELVDVITTDIESCEEKGYSLNDYAILVRLNSQRMIISDILADANVQVDIGSMHYSIRNNKIYQTVAKIIKAVQEEDNALFSEIANIILPYVSRGSFNSYKTSKNKNWYADFVTNNNSLLRADTRENLINLHDTNNAKNAIGYVWLLVKEYYTKLAEKGYYNHEDTLNIFKHLFQTSSGKTVTKFYRMEKAKEQFLEFYCDSTDSIQIKTLHSVKGLEYKNVYLVGLDNDKFPNELHINSIRNKFGTEAVLNYIEEERRLMYVGHTRAIDNLTLSYSVKNPSMFLYELENLELKGVTDDINGIAKYTKFLESVKETQKKSMYVKDKSTSNITLNLE